MLKPDFREEEAKKDSASGADEPETEEPETSGEAISDPEVEAAKAALLWTANPYGKQQMTDLWKTGALTLSDGLDPEHEIECYGKQSSGNGDNCCLKHSGRKLCKLYSNR